jgi:hypothetical protein
VPSGNFDGGFQVSITSENKATSGDFARQGANVAALVLTLVVNVLAKALPLNGQTTAQVSDRFPVYFVPAGYVFSIWGVIYLALTAFTVYQALPRQATNPALRRVGYLFALTGVLNSVWIFMWHYNLFLLTIVFMVALLVTLIAIYLRLDIGRARVSTLERWLVHTPFSIYLAWISVATIANASDVLYDLGWDGFGVSGPTWAIVMLVVASLLTVAVSVTRRDVAYTAVIVWAFIGIMVKQSATPEVANTAAAMAAVVALGLVASLFFGRQPGARLTAGAA